MITLFVHNKIIHPFGGDFIVVSVAYFFVRCFIPVKIRLLPVYVFVFSVILKRFNISILLDTSDLKMSVLIFTDGDELMKRKEPLIPENIVSMSFNEVYEKFANGEDDIKLKIFSVQTAAGYKISKKDFYQCRFINCRFTGCSFARIDFTDVVFESCDLSNISLSDCSFSRVEFEKCKLTGTSFAESSMNNVMMDDVRAEFSNFTGTHLSNCNLQKSTFKEASFSISTFKNTALNECNFELTDFTHSKIKDLDFTQNEISGAFFLIKDLKGVTVTVEQAAGLAKLMGVKIRL